MKTTQGLMTLSVEEAKRLLDDKLAQTELGQTFFKALWKDLERAVWTAENTRGQVARITLFLRKD